MLRGEKLAASDLRRSVEIARLRADGVVRSMSALVNGARRAYDQYMPAYRVPQHGSHRPHIIHADSEQPLLFDVGICARKPTVTVAQLEKRLNDVRKVKLEAEELAENRKETIKDLCARLEEVNSILYRQGDVHKMLYQSQQQVHRYRLRMKELGQVIVEAHNDYDRLRKEAWAIKEKMRCRKCKEVKHYKTFPRDPDKLLGRDSRCNVCQREKTSKWREGLKAKKLGEIIRAG